MFRITTGSLILGAALIAALTSGCLHHTFAIGTGAPQGEQVYKVWHHHWLFGTIRPKHQKRIELPQYCESGNATVYEKTSFVNGLIDILIGFIYSPTTVTILCDDSSTSDVALSAEEVRQIMQDPRFLELVGELAPARLPEAEAALEVLRASVRQTPVGTPPGPGERTSDLGPEVDPVGLAERARGDRPGSP